MNFTTDTQKNIAIVRMSGDLEHESGEELEIYINRLIDEGKKQIVMDFTDVSYVNSAGLRILVQVWKDASRKKAAIKMCCLSMFVQKMFRITNLNSIFSIHSTEKDALTAF